MIHPPLEDQHRIPHQRLGTIEKSGIYLDGAVDIILTQKVGDPHLVNPRERDRNIGDNNLRRLLNIREAEQVAHRHVVIAAVGDGLVAIGHIDGGIVKMDGYQMERPIGGLHHLRLEGRRGAAIHQATSTRAMEKSTTPSIPTAIS